MTSHLAVLQPALDPHTHVLRTTSNFRTTPTTPLVHLNPSLRHTSLLRDTLLVRRARRHGARILVHLHGWSPRLAAALRRMGIHDLDWRHVQVRALGQRFADELVAMGVPPDRVAVMGPCARHWDLPHRDPDGPWLFLGRLARGKGADALIRVADRPVWIAGTGPDERRLRHLATGKDVRFLGWQTDLAPLLAACAAVVLPSRQEGLPICILEALGSSRPAVATDVGVVRDVLPDAIPVDDDEALRHALANVQDVPAHRASAIRERYSPHSIAAQCLDAYQQLLDEP